MPRLPKDLIDKFRQTRKFHHVYTIKKSVFFVRSICNLTGFCVPTVRKMRDTFRVDYEFGLTAVKGDLDSEHEFKANLIDRRFVILPKTIPPARSFDMIVYDGKISDWLVNDMVEIMEKYCLTSEEALSLINSGTDKIIANLRSVYGGRFDREIVDRLSH